MSKEDWFRNFERLVAEHPELSDEDLSKMASSRQRDAYIELADRLKDERKHRDNA